jgi:hypothetical protein
MDIEQQRWTSEHGWVCHRRFADAGRTDLVFVFGSREPLARREAWADISRLYAGAQIIGCSTAGEIRDVNLEDAGITTTAVRFADTQIRTVHADLAEHGSSYDVGVRLADALRTDDLAHVFVLSDGLRVNGSELVRGFAAGLPPTVAVTGGLSGDGAKFEQTLVLLNSPPVEGRVVALGLYGTRLRVGFGSMGGWDPFGPDRVITRSKGNVLYEMDGCSALDLYKQYLGEHAARLPASALLFPLAVRALPEEAPVIRTVLSVDEKEQSMLFAGDVPEGAHARLMMANFDRLIDGANSAARTNVETLGSHRAELAILISCVGRRLVLGQRAEEELEAVREVLGESAAITGFYSYGEIAPFTHSARCELHNQTMTITTLSEG